MILAQDIYKSYGSLQVLKGVNFSAKKGEVVSVMGASGAGKTTLLQILGSLEPADSGKVEINATDIGSLKPRRLSRFRNEHIGFVFQFHHLLPEFTALENICIPGYIAGKDKKKVVARASELLSFLGIADRASHKPSAMSGGEQQRVAVARALINNPSVILADEPTGNLDTRNAEELHNLFLDLRNQFQNTFVIITHNPELAATADRTVRMEDGKVVEG